MGKVVNGDYEGSRLDASSSGVYICPKGEERIRLDGDSVESYEKIEEGKHHRGKRAVIGTVLAGPVGLAVGALSGKAHGILVAVKFKDGMKSLIECDEKEYKNIVKSCF